MIIFKGYKHKSGIAHFRNITLDDIRAVFFPKTFEEKYRYLGSCPYEGGELFQALEPLAVFIDYKAKPWWCPRWVLRFLHLFGMDNSIIRVRNRWMADLLSRLTKGYLIIDYKTKWEWYDLRISLAADDQCWWLADAIERHYYEEGKRKDEESNIKPENI